MRYLITILLIISSISTKAQRQISVSIHQDAKLLFVGDNKGNQAGTQDILISMDWQGNQFKHYYFTIKTQYETARLVGGNFYRYTVNTGWIFNNLIIPKLETAIYIGIGAIHRSKELKLGSLLTYNIMSELNYKILKNSFASIKLELVKRTDLKNKKFMPNVSIGIKQNIFKL